MTYRYDINAPSDDPTFGGTRPLKRVEVKSQPKVPNTREAYLHENNVPCSAYWFKVEAERAARDLAIGHGLDGYYVDGVFKEVKR